MAATRSWGDRVVTILAILLAICFFASGVFKLVSYSAAVEQFERFGYAPWFVVVAAVIEVAAAVLLLFRGTRYWGASLVITTMIAAMLSHLKVDEPQEMVPPLVLMILAMIVAWSGPTPATEAEEDRASKPSEPLVVTICKQVCGAVLCVVGIYVGVICVFGNEPLLIQYPLLRWGGMVLGFGAAFGGIAMFNGPQKEAENARTGQLRTR